MKMSTKAAPAAQSSDRSIAVREHLLDVAERLFAEHGIASVSLNQIARAANQRNTVVIQYHFGSREAMLHAIAERRMEEVNERRIELLKHVSGTDRVADLTSVAEAMVLPFVEHLSREGGSNYVRFVAQLYSDPRLEFFKIIKGKHDSGMREAGRRVREILSSLPPEVVKHRLAVITGMIFTSLADREKLRAAGMHVGVARLHTEHFVGDLIAMIVGALNAPYAKRAGARDDRLPADASGVDAVSPEGVGS